MADSYKIQYKYVNAALIYRYKINDPAGAQDILLDGWRNKRDAYNCLNNYFANIEDTRELGQAIQNVYTNDLRSDNREVFLQVLRHEFNKQNELTEMIKEIAYEVIAAQVSTNPGVVSELKSFNKEDKVLVKDTMRFRLGKNKK